MRRVRHVVLPVKSWQYIGLLVVSLACLTLGLVSRDREGRHGNLAGPELLHTAPHEVDSCPNNSFVARSPSTESASVPSKAFLISHNPTTKLSEVSRDSRLNPRHSDVTRLLPSHRINELRTRAISSERRIRTLINTRENTRFQRSRSSVEGARKTRIDETMRRARSAERLVIDENRRQLTRSVERRDNDRRVSVLQNNRRDTPIVRLERRLDARRQLASRFEQRVRENRRVRDQSDSRVAKRSPPESSVLRDKRDTRRSLNRDSRIQNRIDARAERRSVSREGRVRDDDNRRSVRTERRSIDAGRGVNGNRLGTRVRVESRSLSSERRVRVAENRLDNRAERRSASQERQVRRLLENNRQVRDSKKEGRLSENRRVRATALERQARDLENQRHVRIGEKQRLRNSRLVRDQRLRENDNKRGVRLARDVSRLESLRVRSVDARDGRRDALVRLENRRTRFSEDVRVRESRLRESRENRIITSGEGIRGDRRDAVRSENRRDATQREVFTPRRAEANTQARKNRNLVMNRFSANRIRDNRLMERGEVERRVWNSERKNLLPTAADQLRRVTTRENRLDQNREKVMERRTDSIRDRTMNMFIDSQYLKHTVPKANNLNYEILRQAIIIGFCAMYGASIFKHKTSFIGNLAQYTRRLTIW